MRSCPLAYFAPSCRQGGRWFQLTALPACDHAKGWDIKRWRYRLFAAAGKIIAGARRDHLLLPAAAPERPLIAALLEANSRIAAAPKPPRGPAADLA